MFGFKITESSSVIHPDYMNVLNVDWFLFTENFTQTGFLHYRNNV